MASFLALTRRLVWFVVLFGSISVAAPACLESPAAPRFPDIDERPDDPEREEDDDTDDG